jgi:hypothetical protein
VIEDVRSYHQGQGALCSPQELQGCEGAVREGLGFFVKALLGEIYFGILPREGVHLDNLGQDAWVGVIDVYNEGVQGFFLGKEEHPSFQDLLVVHCNNRVCNLELDP